MASRRQLYGSLLIAFLLSILFWHVRSPESKAPVKPAETRLEVTQTSDRDRAGGASGRVLVASRTGSSTEHGSPGNATMPGPRYVPVGDLSRRRQTAAHEYGIVGIVSKSETGAPVSGASVTCYRNRTPLGFGEPVKTASTDQAGRYHLKLPEPMLCKILVEASGLAAVEAWASVRSPSITKHDLSLPPAESGIAGLVVAAHGKPVGAANVAPAYPFSFPFSFADGRVASLSTRTDTNGRFELPNLPAGKTLVNVFTNGFLPALEEVTLEPGRIASVRIVLQIALTARIRLLNENEPVPQALLFCRTDSSQYGGTTDERGYADIELPRGTTSISCRTHAIGFLTTTFNLELKVRLTQVNVEEAPTVLGQVVSGSGRPVPWASISGGQASVMSDLEGRFSVTPSELPFELIVTALGFLNEEREIDENSVNGLVTIQLRNPQAAISGRVISSEDGRPAKGVSLTISGGARYGWSAMRTASTAS